MKEEFSALGSRIQIEAVGANESEKMLQATESIYELEKVLSRFDPDSELSRLNENPDSNISVGSIMKAYIEAVIYSGELSRGMVDSTLLHEIEEVGYKDSIEDAVEQRMSLEEFESLINDKEIKPEKASPESKLIEVAITGQTLYRPVGIKFDSGGLGKGLAADLAAAKLSDLEYFLVDCGGDIRIGGKANVNREVFVTYPNIDKVLTRLNVSSGAVATSGISQRSWVDDSCNVHHDLLDQSTGESVFSGIVQVTALAPTAGEAETRAKSALLSGSKEDEWLPYGGVIVYDKSLEKTHYV